MDTINISRIIENNYNIDINYIEQIKNAYKIDAKDRGYCVKVIGYQFPHFCFILSAMKHLQKKGFKTIPAILKTKNNMDFIKLGDKFAYVTEWVPSRISNYDNPIELAKVAEKIGELHTCSTGFILDKNMTPRYGWNKWIDVFSTRCDEILDFAHRISQKARKSEFDRLYLKHLNEEIERGLASIEGLRKSNYFYLMNKEVMKCGFCHHDLAHHNILVDKNGDLNIIDFDYCILDSHLHDLSSLMIRAMKDGKWSDERADLILNNYSLSNDIEDEELNVMKYFIKFPQVFWQVGIQYYWEQQLWGEEFFVNKLRKYLDDREEREEFLERYFR